MATNSTSTTTVMQRLGERLQHIETSHAATDQRISNVEKTLSMQVQKLDEVISIISRRRDFDAYGVVKYLATSATLLGTICIAIIYIATSNTAPQRAVHEHRLKQIEEQLRWQSRSLAQKMDMRTYGPKRQSLKQGRNMSWEGRVRLAN